MANARMSDALYFEDLHVGDSWRSRARTITETDVVNFACLTGDFDPLHVDHEFARESPFGKPIAHGLLGLSFVAGLGSHSPAVKTVAFLGIQKWEFLRPAHIGDTLHVVTEILELRPNGRRCGHVTWKRQLVNQAGSVVQSGVFETLVSLARCGQQRRDAAAAHATKPAPHAAAEKFVR